MRFCLLFPDFSFRRSWHGLYKFVSVPDLQEGVEDVDVDQVTTSLLAATEDLIRDRDDAVDRDGPAHPVVAASILERLQVERGCGHGVAAVVEARRGGRHFEALVGSLGVVGRDPLVELTLSHFE